MVTCWERAGLFDLLYALFSCILSLLLYKTRAHESAYKGLVLIALVKSKKSDNLVTCNSCKSLLLHMHNFKVDKISDPLAYFLEAHASFNLDLKHFSCRNNIECSTCLVIYLLFFQSMKNCSALSTEHRQTV